MYKLKITISQPANYIYHMMSVSKVGYNNSYGRKHESIHKEKDLGILKESENELTVSGGEHCGMLYTLLVAKPASSNDLNSLKRYFESIIDLFSYNDHIRTAKKFNDLDNEYLDDGFESFEDAFSMCLEAFSSYTDQILSISEVMLSNIELYIKNIWQEENKILLEYKEKLSKVLEKEYNLVSNWESQLNTSLQVENFEIVIVNSIVDGAQAIDISKSKDLFNINEDIKKIIGFISHEIGTFIILQSLPMSMRENLQEYWLCIESLSTYHNQKVLYEDENLFAKNNQYFEKFNEIYKEDSSKNVLDIIEQAVS